MARRPAVVPDKTGSKAGETLSGSQSEGLAEREQLTAEQTALKSLEREGMVVYFDYDTSEIKPEYRSLVAAHRRYAAR